MFLFFKQKTAYDMRISDWNSDVCSSDLLSPKQERAATVPSDRAKDLSVPVAPAEAPVAPRTPARITLHGVTREDPYAWLRADNWRQVMRDPAVLDPEIRASLEAANAYTAPATAPTTALQPPRFDEREGIGRAPGRERMVKIGDNPGV